MQTPEGIMSSPPNPRATKSGQVVPKGSDRRSFNIIALVLGVAVLAGFTVLPRLAISPNRLIGKPAPDFNLEVVHNGSYGDRVQLSNLKGQAVVLAFWASWCGPCRAEAPTLDRVAQRLRDRGVTVLGVNVNDDPAKAIQFARSMNLSYPIVSDEDGSVGTAFGVSNLPTLVIVDRDGNVSAVRTGATDQASLEALALAAK